MENLAGGSEGAVPAAAFKEALAELVFKFANGLADCWLRPPQTRGGPGKAAFLDNGQEGFNLRKVHTGLCLHTL